MLVKVAPMGGIVETVNVEPGTKVGEILRIAKVDVAGRSIRVDNEEATVETPVNEDESIITLANKMKGGR